MAFATATDVKAYLNLSITTDDALITAMIAEESAFIESWTNRSFASAAHIDVFGGNGGTEHTFGYYPAISVTSVTVDGITIPAAATITDKGYMLLDGRLLLFGYVFGWGKRNCQVVYSAGYATIPADIKRACIDLVCWKYKERTRIGMSTQAMAGETTVYQVAEMPDHVKTILRQYRNTYTR